MATTTRVLDANVNGTVYTSNANAALEALDTCHSGATAPTDEVANGKLWLDTTTTPGILKIYNNATWEVVHSGTVDINGGTIDGTTIGATTPAAVTTSSLVATTADINGGTIDGTVIGGATPAAVTATALTATGAFTSLGIDDNATSTAVTIDASGNVGIGTAAPDASAKLTVSKGASGGSASANAGLVIEDNGNTYLSLMSPDGFNNGIYFGDASDNDIGYINYAHGANSMAFGVNAAERMRIDSSGNVLMGKTSVDNTTEGFIFYGEHDGVSIVKASGEPLILNRLTNDGSILTLRKDGTTVGSIGNSATDLVIATAGTLRLQTGGTNPAFFASTGEFSPAADNRADLGRAALRFDDVYATNGTIQTSDRNEKEAIASLTPTEMLVAARLSSSFKNFKWKDAVAEKGLDAARMHSGIIAQDVQDAFAAEGLDASDYAMFISGTWWETQTEVPAVEAVAEVVDEEGNVVTEAVEAKDAYTRTDTYHTLEEAPVGATERTRLGVRYPELLAFVAAYNDQRFLTIEARLTALEAV